MTTATDCIFCKIVRKEIPCFQLVEDDATLAFMDINPAHDGHCLVIPKGHHPNLFTITPDAFAAVARTVRRVARAVQDALQPDGINLLQANGPGAAQSVLHFHMHILPRRMGDELKMNWGLKPGDKARIAEVAEKIRAKID